MPLRSKSTIRSGSTVAPALAYIEGEGNYFNTENNPAPGSL